MAIAYWVMKPVFTCTTESIEKMIIFNNLKRAMPILGIVLFQLAACSSKNEKLVEECSDSRDPTIKSQEVIINGIESITAGRIVNFPSDIENPNQFFSLKENESIELKDLTLQVIMSFEDQVSMDFRKNTGVDASCLSSSRSNLQRAASDNIISSINIISDTDINEDILSGSDLNNIVSIISLNRLSRGEDITPPNPSNSVSLLNFIGTAPNAPLAFDLAFNDISVSSAATHQFNIAVSFLNGKTFTAYTNAIRIDP